MNITLRPYTFEYTQYFLITWGPFWKHIIVYSTMDSFEIGNQILSLNDYTIGKFHPPLPKPLTQTVSFVISIYPPPKKVLRGSKPLEEVHKHGEFLGFGIYSPKKRPYTRWCQLKYVLFSSLFGEDEPILTHMFQMG